MIAEALAPAKAARLRGLATLELACLALAVLAAQGFIVHQRLNPSCCDAHGYVQIAGQMLSDGPLSKFVYSDLRTYGYPLLLALVMRVAGTGSAFFVTVFELQLALYLAAALLLRNALQAWWPRAAMLAFCGLSLDVYALLYTADTLTDGISLTLAVLTCACWLRLRQRPDGQAALAAGSLLAGYALMVRPANVYLVVAWLAGCALVLVRTPRLAARALRFVAALALVAVVALPQLVNNARFHGVVSPFVAMDLGRLQQKWGVQYLKYATSMQPVGSPVFYPNPLYRDEALDAALPARWYLDNPLRGAATLALHAFNMTDQDLLFTYSYDLDPWYRVPLGMLNHAVVALGLVGLALLLRAGWRSGPPARDATIMLALLLCANLGVYMLAAVEMRFGLLLLAALFPCAGYALLRARAAGRGARVVLGVATAAYVLGSLALSGWVRDQSPQVRAAVAARAEAPVR